MFITDEAAKIPIPSALFGEQEQSYWGYVKLHIHAPWFYCAYVAEYEDGGKFTHMIFLSHLAQLQQMSQMEGLEITELHVSLPAYMTKQDWWMMRPLASVWEGEAPGGGSTEQVYVTLDGERFCINPRIADENQLADKRLLYPISH